MSAFQAEGAGSIPATCSTILFLQGKNKSLLKRTGACTELQIGTTKKPQGTAALSHLRRDKLSWRSEKVYQGVVELE